MKTVTSIAYFVTYDNLNGRLAPEGWSGCKARQKLYEDGNLPEDEMIYGYTQCIEHIKELEEKVVEGKKINENVQFQILSETIISTRVDIPRQNASTLKLVKD